MEHNDDIELQIWNYLDDLCDDKERISIQTRIAIDPVWQQKFREITAIHTELKNTLETEQPSMRFSKNVLDAIAVADVAPAMKKYINYNIIKGIAAFFLITITGMLTIGVMNAKWDTSDIPMPKWDHFNLNFHINGSIINLAIGISIVLALILIDTIFNKNRVVFKSR
jgi:hypothetical protein